MTEQELLNGNWIIEPVKNIETTVKLSNLTKQELCDYLDLWFQKGKFQNVTINFEP